MLDIDLTKLYGYELKKMNQQVKRNIERFPTDFMFQLTEFERNNLWSQIVTANINKTWGLAVYKEIIEEYILCFYSSKF